MDHIQKIKNHIDVQLRNRMLQLGQIDKGDRMMMAYLKKGHKAFLNGNANQPVTYWKNVQVRLENKINNAIKVKRNRLSHNVRLKKAMFELKLILGSREFSKLEMESAKWWENKLNKQLKRIDTGVKNNS